VTSTYASTKVCKGKTLTRRLYSSYDRVVLMHWGVVLAVGLVAASTALAATPLVRTLVRAHGVGHVTVGVSTGQLRSRLWIDRIGGSGIDNGSGYTSCPQKTTSTGTGGVDAMFAFSLPPGSRQPLWRYAGGSRSCVVTVTVHGKGRLVVALRGY
jgi:hypothetical protein